MRVIHIIVGLKPHGAETMLLRLIESAPRDFPNTTVVSLTSVEVIGKALRDKGVTVHALNMTSGLSAFSALLRLIRLIRQIRPDIVQTWMYHADLLGGLAASLAGYRNIVWGVRRTSLQFGDSIQTALVSRLCALLSPWIPKKIICNAEAARVAHIASGYCADRFVVVPNGFDFSRFETTLEQRMNFRRELGLKDGDFIVGAVGRFHTDKGQIYFAQAASLVARSRPDVRFLLVGRGCDWQNSDLTEILVRYGVKDKFVLLGEQNDVPACLAGMDIFCMPSSTEGFPNGLCEAMAVGLPCVATNVGDTALLADNTVILVPPQDSQAIADGLLAVTAMSHQQRVDFGQKAKARVVAEYSIAKAHERFVRIYQNVLQEGAQ